MPFRMRRLKSIDEIYREVRDYDLVITNDAALETALNARVDTVRMGTFAITPRHLAGDLSYCVLREREISDLELVAEVSRRTELDFKYVYSEIQNFRDIRRYTSDVMKYITTKRSRRVYEAYESLPTRERVMSAFDNTGELPDILRDKRTAVIGVELFDDLDKHFVPLDCDFIDIFHDDGGYDIPEIREVGNDRQLAENAVDLIDGEHAGDYAIVLKASSPIADAVRAALYRRRLPFVNSLNVRDLAQVRDYIGFLGYCMEYETVRVGQVKELFAALNGFFKPGREGFLLSKVPDEDLRDHARDFRDLMRTAFYDGITFAEVMDRFCDNRARIQVGIVINSLGLADKTVTPNRLSELRYAVDNVTELKHNEEIPENEKTGVLIADCSNSVFVDKPVVIYLGMEQDWNIPVVGRRYVDAEDEAERNATRLEALLQQGSRRVYMVNSTKNGKKARPGPGQVLQGLRGHRPSRPGQMGSQDRCREDREGRGHNRRHRGIRRSVLEIHIQRLLLMPQIVPLQMPPPFRGREEHGVRQPDPLVRGALRLLSGQGQGDRPGRPGRYDIRPLLGPVIAGHGGDRRRRGEGGDAQHHEVHRPYAGAPRP